MKLFIGSFIKGCATTLLVVGSAINIFNVGGGTGIVAALLNLFILIAIWFPMD